MAEWTPTVITANLRCELDNWPLRLARIAPLLAQLAPDAIAFQEVPELGAIDGRAMLVTLLRDAGYIVRASVSRYTHLGWETLREHVMLVTRHAAHEALNLDLPASPLQRGVVGLQIDDWLISTAHLEYGDQHAGHRREQAAFLADRLRGRRALLLGDFNAAPNAPELEPLRAVATPYSPGLTYPVQAPRKAIDHVWDFTRRQHAVACRTVAPQLGDDWLSDHQFVEWRPSSV